MRKLFVKNLILVIVINALIKPFYLFGIDMQVQNRLGEATYGWYFVLFNFTFLQQIIADFGLQNFIRSQWAAQPQQIQQNLPKLLSIKLVLGGLFFCSVFICALLLGYRWNDPLLWSLAGVQLANSALLFVRSVIAAQGKYTLDSLLSVLDKLLLIVFMSFYLYGDLSLDILVFAKSHLLALIIATVVASGFIKEAVRLDFGRFKTTCSYFLRQTAPFALIIILMGAYTRIDAIMLERLLGSEGNRQAGIYAAAYRILDALNIFGLLTAGLLMPMFSKLLKDKAGLQQLIRLSFYIVWGIACVSCFALMVSADLIFPLLYPAATSYWISVYKILLLVFVCMSTNYIYSTLLTSAKKLKAMNIAFVAAIVLNVVGNAVFIPKYAAEGAAVVTLVTQSFVLLCMIGIGIKQHLIGWNKKVLITSLGLAFSLAAIILVVPNDGSIRQLVFCLLLGLIVCALYGYFVYRTSKLKFPPL